MIRGKQGIKQLAVQTENFAQVMVPLNDKMGTALAYALI